MGQNCTKYGRGRTAGTGGRSGSTTPSKVWSWVLVYWTAAISKTSFTNKSGYPPPPPPLNQVMIWRESFGIIHSTLKELHKSPKKNGVVIIRYLINWDPLSLPSCDWNRVNLALLWNISGGRAAGLIYSCQARGHGFDSQWAGVSRKFRIVWMIIPAYLIKQPNSTLSRMYEQTYISGLNE